MFTKYIYCIYFLPVQSFGTEDRPTEFKVPAQSQIYNYILFRGSDIKDIKVITPQIALNDPAIVQVTIYFIFHLSNKAYLMSNNHCVIFFSYRYPQIIWVALMLIINLWMN